MMRRLLLVLALTIPVAMIAGAVWLQWALLRPTDNPELLLEVAPGSSARGVLEQLYSKGLLKSPLAGRVYLSARAAGRDFRFGRYRVAAGARPVDVIEQVLDGRVETISLTVVEGSTAAEVVELFVSTGFGTRAEWNRLIAMTQGISDIAPEAGSLEGFLFPDTYRFAVGLPAEQVTRHMVDRFSEVWRSEAASAAVEWGSNFDVVIMASLVEAETSLSEERARIAGVFVNRLRRGMLLQCDPTVVYALKRRGEWQGRLLRIHWLVDDPFNTYRYPGLPPGPINSPGRAALAAALNPEQHDYLYFVASPDGGHTFSKTLREHNHAVARLQRSRR